MVSTSELLLQADRLRPRSQQVSIGMSDLGSCRKRTGFKLAGVQPVNQLGSVVAAMGSSIHDSVNSAVTHLAVDGMVGEQHVEFAGIPGTFDRTEDDEILVDVKTTSSRYLEHLKLHGADHNHIWQVSCYAAGRIQQGYPIKRIRIDYLARDTGEEYQWPSPEGRLFDVQDVRDALDWLKLVRDSELDRLPRDFEPDSVFCRTCPYGGLDGGLCWEGHVPSRDLRSVLYVEDPDAQKWADELRAARDEAKAATARAQRAAGALSAVIDPNGIPTKCGTHWLRYDARNALRFVSEPRPVEIGF
jgi:hypothetical protein